MVNEEVTSPAERASLQALQNLFSCIDNKKSFLFEAGAGAGKTYSLVEALNYIIADKGASLMRNAQKVVCITYTNVAKDEIFDRTDSNPLVVSETIHSFCWSLMSRFQNDLRNFLPEIGKWKNRIEEVGSLGRRTIKYDLGYPKIEESEAFLYHDDVVELFNKFMEKKKFRQIVSQSFPYIFIDEYQDTSKKVAEALLKHFVDEENSATVIGFFGDSWQTIFGSASCGSIENNNLEIIAKGANFRSERLIVECLNKIRPELPQSEKDPQSEGHICVFHTNSWDGDRKTGGHWAGDLPDETAAQFFNKAKEQLENDGWEFSAESTKVLMLTHNVLADKQGYRSITNHFSNTDKWLKKEDPYIAFFADVVEPVSIAYKQKNYGEMFSALDKRTPVITSHSDKISWATDMGELIHLREEGSIGDVIDHLVKSKRPRLPDKLEKQERRRKELKETDLSKLDDDEKRFLEKRNNFRSIPYKEVISISEFMASKTPFATKHGVKGDEFDNVMIVFGRGWNLYNFDNFLKWSEEGIPNGKEGSYERNRNLFYVACSRPKKRLALLFTQKLSASSIKTLENWFQPEKVVSLSL